MASDYQTYGNWLLLLGGAVHAIPQLNSWLTGVGSGWVQIVVGVLSVVVALMCMKG